MPTLKKKFEDAATDLAEAKAWYQEAQRRFDALYKMVVNTAKAKATSKVSDAEPGVSEHPVQPVNGTGEKMTITAKIEEFLAEHQDEAIHYRDIADAIGSTPNTCRTMLSLLSKDGKAVKVARGKWSYPSGTEPKLPRRGIQAFLH